MAVTRTYLVSGLTCGACLALVLDAVRSLPGVRSAAVDLVRGGVSRLVITATRQPAAETIRAAVKLGGFALEPPGVQSGSGSPTAGPEKAQQTLTVNGPVASLTVPTGLGQMRKGTVVPDAATSRSRAEGRSHHQAARADAWAAAAVPWR